MSHREPWDEAPDWATRAFFLTFELIEAALDDGELSEVAMVDALGRVSADVELATQVTHNLAALVADLVGRIAGEGSSTAEVFGQMRQWAAEDNGIVLDDPTDT